MRFLERLVTAKLGEKPGGSAFLHENVGQAVAVAIVPADQQEPATQANLLHDSLEFELVTTGQFQYRVLTAGSLHSARHDSPLPIADKIPQYEGMPRFRSGEFKCVQLDKLVFRGEWLDVSRWTASDVERKPLGG